MSITKRKRKLLPYIEKIRETLSSKFSDFTDVFIVDSTPANVHDVNYLKDIKENFRNCLLIGNRGYISSEFQIDLLHSLRIDYCAPMRKNQHNLVESSKAKSRIRKRTENTWQLCGQFSLNIHFAKTFQGLATRVVLKILLLR